ncbi:hypothetical protein RRG08_017834 [Elysia crispata]|uniref:Uncharacterized protein n=1 Tax=Elysia crispata TaxID=231223 RepID=A0AAE1CJW2_9GAST|nr:hypothetical protein RRG08_017834 [Elysia crispata]
MFNVHTKTSAWSCLDQQYQTSVPDINLCLVHYNKERTLKEIFCIIEVLLECISNCVGFSISDPVGGWNEVLHQHYTFPNPRSIHEIFCDATFDQNSVCSEDVQEFSASEERTFTVSPSPLNAVTSLSTVSSCPTRINPSPTIDVPTAGPSGKTPKPAKRKAEEQLLTMVQDHLKALEEDENDVYAKTVAFKMRKLDPIQRFYAEKLMNDVLFEAGLDY